MGKKRTADSLSLPNKNATLINVIQNYFIRYRTSTIKLNLKKIYLNNRLMKNITPSHVCKYIITLYYVMGTVWQ